MRQKSLANPGSRTRIRSNTDMDMDWTRTMACPKCGNIVAVTDQFCSQCGDPLKRPSFWQRIGKWFQSGAKPGPRTLVIKKNFQEYKFKDATGKEQVYHSLDEMPPETRALFEKLRGRLGK